MQVSKDLQNILSSIGLKLLRTFMALQIAILIYFKYTYSKFFISTREILFRFWENPVIASSFMIANILTTMYIWEYYEDAKKT